MRWVSHLPIPGQFDFTVELRPKRGQVFVIVNGERKFEVALPEHDGIAARLESKAAFHNELRRFPDPLLFSSAPPAVDATAVEFLVARFRVRERKRNLEIGPEPPHSEGPH